jgi:uncharacterized repeat protein (TIGR01451 family)
MSRRLPLLALFVLLIAQAARAQVGYAYRGQSVEPPLATDPDAQEKIKQAGHQDPRPVAPNVRVSDVPAPAVVIRVQAPTALPTGQNAEVRLIVENVSRVPARNVIASCTFTPQAAIMKAVPPQADGGWRFEKLDPGERREIVLTIQPGQGTIDLETKARVIVEQEQTAKTRFAAGRLKITKTGPVEARQFDILVFGLDVYNVGPVDLTNVLVTDILPAGLAHRPEDDKDRAALPGTFRLTSLKSDAQTRTWKIDRLPAGHSQRIEYHVQAATAPPGPVQHGATAEADGGVKDTDAKTVTLTTPQLDMKAVAPPRKSASEPGAIQITLTNNGNRPLQNIVVTDRMDPCKVDEGPGMTMLQDGVQWIVPVLAPKQSRTLEALVHKTDGGLVRHQVSAVYRAMPPLTAAAQTEFEAVALLAYEFRGSTATVEVNGEVDYEITVRNNGSAPATNIRPTIELPPELTLVKAEPENKVEGGKVAFEPIPTLPPTKWATFRVKAKAVKASLGARVTAELGGDPFPTGPVRRQVMTAIGASPPAPPAPAPTGAAPLPVPVPPPQRPNS